ncbi:MAG TPA: hypothetical protein ACFYEM_11440, partial [Candidatus Hypogeohydataceae bacterium YC40]
MKIEFKNEPIECCFSYFYNEQFSLVVDIIRHHEIIFSRIFFHEKSKDPLPYNKYCCLPPEDKPFLAEEGNNYRANMVINDGSVTTDGKVNN